MFLSGRSGFADNLLLQLERNYFYHNSLFLRMPVMSRGSHSQFIVALCVICLISTIFSVRAQDLEPRAYINTPVGMNFSVVGYQYSEGALLFDPALPVDGALAKVNMGFIGYVRTLDITGKSAKAGILLPFADLDAQGYVDSIFRTREDSGLADPSFYLPINLYGAPALSYDEFRDYKQETIIGASFKITAPLGVYDKDKLLNIGTNRWSFKSELGVSRALNRLSLEAAIAATLYSDNDDFDNGKTRSQDAIYSLQGHVVYTFPGNIWASVGATYFTGGRTTIEGVGGDDLQQNWRTGFTLALPVNRHHSIKIFGNSGISTRTGDDYDSLGVAWQYRWGGGV
jgi:hypothetical protein